LESIIDDYLSEHFVQESEVLHELYEFALKHQFAHKLTRPVQTRFLCFLLKMMGAKRVIELGTFLGYSTLAMAEALPTDGEVIAVEHNEKWLNMGKPFWEKAGVANKISPYVDDASIALQCLLDEGQGQSFDFIYIDAEKRFYDDYLEKGLQLIHNKGVLAFDNVLHVIHGNVADPQSPTTRALAEFNKNILKRDDLDVSLLPMFDGLLLVRFSR
jgi:predicted O-methyltransferase YrrM